MQTITRYLENLRESVDGDELHGIIARTLRRHSRKGPLGPDYLIDLYGQLDAYARDPLSLPSMRIRARLLQQHIGPYIADLKIDALPEAVSVTTETSGMPVASEAGDAAVQGVLEPTQEQATAQERQEEHQALLRSEQDAWQAIYGTVKDYQRLKDAWLKSLDQLSSQRDALEDKLAKTTEQLTQLETEHTKLRAKLQTQRSRTQTLPRLLTRASTRSAALPKREGFVRSLEAEIKRSKRSGAPLALGLIGVESLNVLTERHGNEAAAAALRCYTEEVLCNFRAYDLVGMYDEDQFIVLFPDTPKEGARRALEKAYKRAVETHLNHEGKSIPLPPFTGALITYSAGEEPAKFLGRADAALNHVRTNHQHGVVLS